MNAMKLADADRCKDCTVWMCHSLWLTSNRQSIGLFVGSYSVAPVSTRTRAVEASEDNWINDRVFLSMFIYSRSRRLAIIPSLLPSRFSVRFIVLLRFSFTAGTTHHKSQKQTNRQRRAADNPNRHSQSLLGNGEKRTRKCVAYSRKRKGKHRK